MRFKEADGRKVVSADCAESIGRIEAYVIDTGGRSVSAFRLAKAKGDATFVSWEDAQFGPDAVVVPSSDRIRTARDEEEARAASKDLQPVGKLVLDESGTALGKVGTWSSTPAPERSSSSTSATRRPSRPTGSSVSAPTHRSSRRHRSAFLRQRERFLRQRALGCFGERPPIRAALSAGGILRACPRTR
jgi:hypothetical protein